MRITLTFLFVYLISLQTQAQDEGWIIWETDSRLDWEDFLGEVSESKYKAETHWRIYYDFQISLLNTRPFLSDYNVRTEFSKDKSWVKEGGGSDHLLFHEQGHFDLAEIYARKFRWQLDNLTFSSSNFQNEMDSLFDNILVQCDETQNNYDLETEHGLKIKIQENWQEFITKELKLLEDYSISE